MRLSISHSFVIWATWPFCQIVQHFSHLALKEIEKAWKMVDSAHDKEIRAKETIHTLKQEITNLTKLVEQGAGLSVGQEHR